MSERYVHFEDFVLQLETSPRGGFRARVLESPFGEGIVEFSLPNFAGRVAEDRDASGSLCDVGRLGALSTLVARPPLEIGSEIFRAVFQGPVRMLFDKSRARLDMSPDLGLRLKIKLDPSEHEIGALADLPWELLCDGETEDFFALSRQQSLVRYLDIPRFSQPIPFDPPLRVLAVAASPRNLHSLALEEETRRLEHLGRSSSGVEVHVLAHASFDDVRAALAQDTYHVVHFMGHGTFNQARSHGTLAFEGPDGSAEQVSGKTFATRLKGLRSLGVVVLNACDTARAMHDESTNPFRGVATALVLGGIPAVVAMQRPISDLAAIGFTTAFYQHLARGDSVDEAMTEGRHAIHSARPESCEWATPVLFLRIPHGNVFVANTPVRRAAPITPPTNGNGLRGLKSLFLLAASLGSLLPGFAFFLGLSPPFFPGAAPITALAAAVVAIAFAWPQKRRVSAEQYKRQLLLSAVIVLVSLLLAVLYVPLYRLTTVTPPVPPPTIICQTGFGLTHLTESAKLFINKYPAMANSQDLMLAFAAFAGCRSDLIWESWSISIAGVTLITLFSAASLLWAFGFAHLAKLLSHPARKTKAALPLMALTLFLSSCISERLPSAHVTSAERVKNLEAKVKELDGRVSKKASPAQH